MRVIVLIFIASLFLAASCHKKPPYEWREVFPIMPVSITPEKDTFRVNDTLTLEIDFPEQLRDSLSGQMVTFKNFNFGSIIVFYKLIDSSANILQQQPNGSNYEVINTDIGKVNPPATTTTNATLSYSNGRYQLKSKLVVKDKGIMTISFVYALPNQTEAPLLGHTADGRPIKGYIDKIKYFINEGRTNFHIYKQHCKASFAYTDEQNWVENTGTFTFVVR